MNAPRGYIFFLCGQKFALSGEMISENNTHFRSIEEKPRNADNISAAPLAFPSVPEHVPRHVRQLTSQLSFFGTYARGRQKLIIDIHPPF